MDNNKRETSEWITAFLKQCFVTLGQTLAVSQVGMVMAFTSSLLPQLRTPDSLIIVDDAAGSWIVSLPFLTAFSAAFFTPFLMGKLGRQAACIFTLVLLIFAWLLITLATNLTSFFISRTLQGVCIGIIICLAPIYIGECASPKNRGAFLTLLSLSLASGTFIAHVLGSYLSWQKTSLVCGLITFVDLLIVLYCPETPSWLVEKGRYDEAKKVHVWLRGKGEDDELKKMVAAHVLSKETTKGQRINPKELTWKNSKLVLSYLKTTIRKPEFYKPIIIMINLNAVMLFSGVNMIAAYTVDTYGTILGDEVDVDLVIASADIQRLISNSFALYLMKKVKRRTMLIWIVSLNSLIYIILAGYIYGKSIFIIPEKAYIGITLIHLLMLTIAWGSVPLPLIVAGEIFPLEFRSFSSVLILVFNAPISFIILKTFPFLMQTMGLHGAFLLYATCLEIFMLISWVMLPETKDKTLLEIENEFKKKIKDETDTETMQSLKKCDRI